MIVKDLAHTYPTATGRELQRATVEGSPHLHLGSYMVISHATYDGSSSETLAQLARLYAATPHPLGLRSRAQFAGFFDGFEVIAPGIVFTPAWRPDGSPSPFTTEPERAAVLAGVGRKL